MKFFRFSKLNLKIRGIYEHHWENFHFSRRREWSMIARWFNMNKKSKVCDLGCGKGFYTRKLSLYGCIVYGIDKNKKEIRSGKKYNKTKNNRFVIADAQRLPVKRKKLDGAVSISSMEHFENDKETLKELARVLKPEGKLYLTVDSLSNLSDVYRMEHAKKYGISNYYTRNDVKKMLSNSDFELEENEYILNSRISGLFFKFHSSIGFSGVPLLLFFISHPLSIISDEFFGAHDKGCVLAIKAKRIGE